MSTAGAKLHLVSTPGTRQEEVGHLGAFCPLFYEYCEFGHTYFVTYCFSPTI